MAKRFKRYVPRVYKVGDKVGVARTHTMGKLVAKAEFDYHTMTQCWLVEYKLSLRDEKPQVRRLSELDFS